MTREQAKKLRLLFRHLVKEKILKPKQVQVGLA